MPPAPSWSPFRRRWTLFVNCLVAVWAALFIIVLTHVDYTLLHVVPPAGLVVARRLLLYLLPVFLVNLVLRYRWSGLTFPQFFRRNWLDFLMLIPFLRAFQFFRFFRFGRAALALREATRLRKVFNFGRKLRRIAMRWLRARAVFVQAQPAPPGEATMTPPSSDAGSDAKA